MIPNPYPGKFFVFEGCDGCGKSTQLEMIFDRLKGKIPGQMVRTKEPGKERFFGKKIYEDLFTSGGLHETDLHGFQTWYACDSKEHLREVVIPSLRAGSIVLSDRFRPSMVYGAGNPREISELMDMNKAIIGEYFIWPDAIFIFDVSVKTALQRLANKLVKLDEHEKAANLLKVSNNYRYFAKKYPNCHFINAERDPEEIFNEVIKIIGGVLFKEL